MPCVKILLYVNEDNNLKSTYNSDFDSNFKKACDMLNRNFSHDELISMLDEGNIVQKQLAALTLDNIYNNIFIIFFI